MINGPDIQTDFIRRRIIMEKYETPEIEIIEFDAEDIITTSDGEMQPVS